MHRTQFLLRLAGLLLLAGTLGADAGIMGGPKDLSDIRPKRLPVDLTVEVTMPAPPSVLRRFNTSVPDYAFAWGEGEEMRGERKLRNKSESRRDPQAASTERGIPIEVLSRKSFTNCLEIAREWACGDTSEKSYVLRLFVERVELEVISLKPRRSGKEAKFLSYCLAEYRMELLDPEGAVLGARTGSAFYQSLTRPRKVTAPELACIGHVSRETTLDAFKWVRGVVGDKGPKGRKGH